jgi:hypothetical protein
VRTSFALLRGLAAVLLACMVACGVVGCGADDTATPRTEPTQDDFCALYVAHRDGPAKDAASFADALEEADVPAALEEPARVGLAVYLSYLRNEGDGHDEDMYDDQYAVVLDRSAHADLLTLLDATDDECGVARSDAAPTDASTKDYCAAFESIFEPRRSDLLGRTGTPTGLGADDSDDDMSAEVRRGFRAVADVVSRLTPEQAEVLEAADDDAMRQLLGVTDAFFADTWFLSSYQLCVGED